MKGLKYYLIEKIDEESLWSLKESIQFVTESNDINGVLKKWLRQHKAQKIKVEDGMLVLTGKTGMVTNELHFDKGETDVPDNVKIKNENFTCGFLVTGPDLKTIKWIPSTYSTGQLYLEDCDSLEDFDAVMFNGIVNIKNCKKLKSFSGMKSLKGKDAAYFYIENCPSLEIDDFEGVKTKLNIKNCGIKSLKGYPVFEETYTFGKQGSSVKIENCDNLVSLDIKSDVAPKEFDFKDCGKLSKVGNCSWPKDGETNYYYFWKCSSVDEKFLEELYDMSSHGEYGAVSIGGTKISPNSQIIKRIKKERPEWSITT